MIHPALVRSVPYEPLTKQQSKAKRRTGVADMFAVVLLIMNI
jgi:hypothetical protein